MILHDLDLIEKIDKWKSILSSKSLDHFPDHWTGLKEVQLAHISLMNEFLEQNFIIPNYKDSKGIVIGAGGAKYFSCAFACVYILKKLGCELPIEFWYLDEYEIDNNMKKLCDYFGIRYINAMQYCAENNLCPRILNGWELKPFSTLYSSFKEVLYLDADNIPVKDPTYLFDLQEYKNLGAIFWPDLPPQKRKEWLPPIVWENIGLEYRDEVDFETGQYLINKEKCFKELSLTMWMNEHSDWFYKFIYGDKSTFHLAWRKCNSDYVIPKKAAGWRHPCILQYDLNDNLIFQHACQGKELICSGNGPRNQEHYLWIQEAKKIREQYWSGIIYSWNAMNDQEKLLAQKFIGRYLYTRVGLNSREIVLSDQGVISQGQAKCERRWSLRLIDDIPTLVIIGAAHKDSEIAMFFAKDTGDNKTFVGKWTAFEKCDIKLERML